MTRTWAGTGAFPDADADADPTPEPAPAPTEQYSGTGAKVVTLTARDARVLTVTHSGSSNVAVWAYGDSRDLLVNEIGAYSGETLLPAGSLVLAVEADGPWSLAKS